MAYIDKLRALYREFSGGLNNGVHQSAIQDNELCFINNYIINYDGSLNLTTGVKNYGTLDLGNHEIKNLTPFKVGDLDLYAFECNKNIYKRLCNCVAGGYY